MKSSPEFNLRVSTPVIPSGEGPRLVYGKFEIKGEEGSGILSSNLGFLIDISESMRIRLVTGDQFSELVKNGFTQEIMTDGVPAFQISAIPMEMVAEMPRRIDYVIEAMRIASEMLRERDTFSLVAFASQAECLIEQCPGRERDRLRKASLLLESLQLGDGTRLDKGLQFALRELTREPGQILPTRLILLTDGHTQNVAECYEIAKQARKRGIKIATMGIGSEFNEDLLIPLADLTGGNAYFVESPDLIPGIFNRELGSAMNILYRNLELKFLLPEGISLRNAYRVLPELSVLEMSPAQDGNLSLVFGDYEPSFLLEGLFEFVVEDGTPGTTRTIKAMLVWDDQDAGIRRQSVRKSIHIENTVIGSVQTDPEIMAVVERVGAFKFGTSALADANKAMTSLDSEEKSAATVRLRQAATRMLDLGEDDLAEELMEQASNFEAAGSLDPEAAKKIRYKTRRLGQFSQKPGVEDV